MKFLFCDWKRNERNVKGRLILFSFRLANVAKKGKIYVIILLPYLIFYRIPIEWFLAVELPWKTSVGKRLIIYHG